MINGSSYLWDIKKKEKLLQTIINEPIQLIAPVKIVLN
jgi:hypothetical protein